MNYSFKLKVKQQPSASKDEPSVRRIRTDHVDALKKITKQPLAENKKILYNNQQTLSVANPSKPAKKVTAIKSVLNKNVPAFSRLTTEPSERPHYLHHQRTATAGERIGMGQPAKKQMNIDLNSTNVGGFKKKETKVRENSCKSTEPLKLLDGS